MISQHRFGALLPFFTLSRTQATIMYYWPVKTGERFVMMHKYWTIYAYNTHSFDWLYRKAFRLKLSQLTAPFKIFKKNNDSTFRK